MKMIVSGIVALCLSAFAYASGRTLPITTEQSFESPQSCLATLEKEYTREKSQIVPRTIDADGKTREINLITKGIERIDAETARYEAKLWYHHGLFRRGEERIETSHSWDHYVRECNGKTLRTTHDRGYTLSTFDPVDPSSGQLR